jgi:hypothetical protein
MLEKHLLDDLCIATVYKDHLPHIFPACGFCKGWKAD